MSLSVLIKYNDPLRPDYFNGFCSQSTLRDFWWPVAERLGLPALKRLEVLHITDRAEAVALVRELRIVEAGLRARDHLGESKEMAEYLLPTLAILLPVLDAAIAEWDRVKFISL